MKENTIIIAELITEIKKGNMFLCLRYDKNIPVIEAVRDTKRNGNKTLWFIKKPAKAGAIRPTLAPSPIQQRWEKITPIIPALSICSLIFFIALIPNGKRTTRSTLALYNRFINKK